MDNYNREQKLRNRLKHSNIPSPSFHPYSTFTLQCAKCCLSNEENPKLGTRRIYWQMIY